MEKKKSDQANLENKRGSIILLGMVCATSLTLMSFEYAKFEMKQGADLMSEKEVPFDICDFPEIEVIKPSAPAPSPKPKMVEYVEADDEAIETEEEIIVEDKDKKFPDIPEVPDGIGHPGDEGPILDPPISEPVIPDKMPHFPGGDEEMYKYLSKKITFPKDVKDIGIQGKVYIQFTVEKDGSITNLDVVKTPHKRLGNITSEVVSAMPNWVPGFLNNEPVRVRFTLPVNFVLD